MKDTGIFGGVDEGADLLRLRYGQARILDAKQVIGQFVGKVCACKKRE